MLKDKEIKQFRAILKLASLEQLESMKGLIEEKIKDKKD